MQRGGVRLRSGGGYRGGGGNGGPTGGGGMSKRGGAARRGGRFLSTEEEDRLRANILRRNSVREEGSEISATEEMEQVIVENPDIDSVADRVRRLEGGQGGCRTGSGYRAGSGFRAGSGAGPDSANSHCGGGCEGRV